MLSRRQEWNDFRQIFSENAAAGFPYDDLVPLDAQ